jgi:TPR repeat protein
VGSPVSSDAQVSQLEKKVLSGDVESQYQLAQRLCCGSDQGQNSAKAFYLYCLAAKSGHEKAQYQLGRLYEEGMSLHQTGEASRYFLLPVDLAKANLWYMLSERAQYSDAKRARKKLSERIHPDQVNESYKMLKNWRQISCQLL